MSNPIQDPETPETCYECKLPIVGEAAACARCHLPLHTTCAGAYPTLYENGNCPKCGEIWVTNTSTGAVPKATQSELPRRDVLEETIHKLETQHRQDVQKLMELHKLEMLNMQKQMEAMLLNQSVQGLRINEVGISTSIPQHVTPISHGTRHTIVSLAGTSSTPVTIQPTTMGMWPQSATIFRQSRLTPHGMISTPSSNAHGGIPACSAPLTNTLDHSSLFTPHFRYDEPGAAANLMPQLTPMQITARKTLRLELPVFSGNVEDFPAFITFYEETTASCGLTDRENLIRLIAALRGKAKEHVKGLLTVPQNVPYLIARLKALFGQPSQIINSQLTAIRNIHGPSFDKMDVLIEFGIAVHNLVTTMVSTNMTGYLSSPNLLEEIVMKLPASLAIQWTTYARAFPNPDLQTFDTWLDALTLDACRITQSAPHTRKSEPKKRVLVHNEAPKREKDKECVICKQSCKSPRECDKFLKGDRDERWDLVRKFSLCRICLFPHRNSCRNAKRCGVNECQRYHNPLLHAEKSSNPPAQTKNPSEATGDTPPKSENHLTHGCSTTETLFGIVPVKIRHNDKIIDQFAFIDSGSSITLIDRSVTEELGLKGEPKPLCLQWTNNESRTEDDSEVVQIEISGVHDHANEYTLNNVRTVKNLGLPLQTFDAKEMTKLYPHLQGLPLRSFKNAKPLILIGVDNMRVCTTLKTKEGNPEDPIAVKSRLGWSVCGKTTGKNSDVALVHVHRCDCEEMIKKHYELDSIGITKRREALFTDDEARAMKIMEETTRHVGDRFETGLLWASDEVKLPYNRTMAEKRLRCLQSKLERDPILNTNVQQQIRDMEKENMIKRLTVEEETQINDKIWYLPVFPVTNPNKPDKVRLVWDAAARFRNVSLNSVLLTGPDDVPLLTQPLLRMRERKIAVCGDIRAMFHQVKIRDDDQNAQRFLWPSENAETSVYVMTRMTFGAACSPASAQFVKNSNAKQFQDEFPRASRAIIENHYVDDFLDSTDTVDEALKLVKEVKMIHANAGFEIRNFLSNAREITDELNAIDSPETVLPIGKDQEKILGMWWSPKTDEFTYVAKFHKMPVDVIDGIKTPTKRQLLSLVMSIFDPNGHLSSFLINLKLLLQRVVKDKIDWDDQIGEKHESDWHNWRKQLSLIEKVKIPRCFLKRHQNYENAHTALHTFVDASLEAYAIVSYIRIVKDGIIDVAQVGAKSRVASVSINSVPRLELQAALVGARYTEFLKKALTIPIHATYYWTDSSTVFRWIRNTNKKFKPFVAYRIAEIRELSAVSEWHWLNTKTNVADEATKMRNCVDLEPNSRWWNGPEFLHAPDLIDEEPPEETEVSCEEIICIHTPTVIDPALVDVLRFGNWESLVKTVAYIFKVADIAHRKPCETKWTSDQLARAEIYLFKMAQDDSFKDEKVCLQRQQKLPKRSFLRHFNPYLDDDGVIRLETRIVYAAVSEATRRPVLLPHHHRITELVVKDFHERYLHGNRETVLVEVQKRFHVPKLRRLVRKITNDCQFCRSYKSQPKIPQMAPLPIERMALNQPPFTYTGVDFFGPLMIKVRRSQEKRYGVLFTCMTTRAVHLELAASLDVNSCVLAIRNFCNRRREPRMFLSDRGTNFIATERLLRRQTNEIKSEVASRIVTSTTEWRFNPPLSPNMGGSWERLVQSAKKGLYVVLRHFITNEEILRSALIEIENVINSRPLTTVSIDPNEDFPITPNDLLRGPTAEKCIEIPDTEVDCRQSWRTSQIIANQFWKKWLGLYLPELRKREKWTEKVPQLNPGDVVAIADPSLPRGMWPKGVVQKTFPAKDGQTRVAEIRTKNGILTRPASKTVVIVSCASSTGGEIVRNRTE